jgi:hypothetical protein
MKKRSGDSQQWDAIRLRLDVIITLLLDRVPDAGITATDKIQRLLNYGLPKAEVARIIGKPTNFVTAITANKQRRKAKK